MILRLTTVHENGGLGTQPSPPWGGVARDGAFTRRRGTGEGVLTTRAVPIFMAVPHAASGTQKP